MSDEELDTLAEDIKANGQLYPVIYDQSGQLIDGRNRLAACNRIGMKPKTDTLAEGIDPVAFILSANVNRRHMSKGQAAMAVAKALSLETKERKRDGQKENAASAVGTSAARVSQAITVLTFTPELAEPVLSGALSLDAAYQQARTLKLAKESQDEAIHREQVEREAAARRDEGFRTTRLNPSSGESRNRARMGGIRRSAPTNSFIQQEPRSWAGHWRFPTMAP